MQRIAVGVFQFACHLVKTDAGIDGSVKHGFFLCFIHLLLRFQYVLAQGEELRIVLACYGQCFIHRDTNVAGTSGKAQPYFCILIEVEERCQAEHGALQCDLGILQGVAGVDGIELQGQQLSLDDGSDFVPFLSDTV